MSDLDPHLARLAAVEPDLALLREQIRVLSAQRGNTTRKQNEFLMRALGMIAEAPAVMTREDLQDIARFALTTRNIR